ncbi:hypothetical protein R0J90_02625 [Micrococcus sp. SIMBA_144]
MGLPGSRDGRAAAWGRSEVGRRGPGSLCPSRGRGGRAAAVVVGRRGRTPDSRLPNHPLADPHED